MPAEEISLDVAGIEHEGRLNTPTGETNGGILVVPGAGHGPFGDVFDRFAAAAASHGFAVARFETWETRADLDEKSMADHAAEIETGVEYLQAQGCNSVHVVAKSYGGRLALELVPETAGDAVDSMVLWAPAIIYDDHPEAPTIEAQDLEPIEVPIRILQGDEDHIPVESAANIAAHLPNGELVELPGEDHSFQNDQERIVDETLAFLAT